MKIVKLILLSLLLSIMYMTNAWDGLIYLMLACLTLLIVNLSKQQVNIIHNKKASALKNKNNRNNETKQYIFNYSDFFQSVSVLVIGFVVFSLPFNLNFKPFVSGIGVMCAPEFLIKLQHFGPFIFEPNHCARSPLWQLLILYGFFFFSIFSLIAFVSRKKPEVYHSDIFVLILILVSLLLILAPEFIYAKDIYPAHYRANTMFKLGYQAFIMFSIASGYIFIRIVSYTKNHKIDIFKIVYILIFSILFSFIMRYPGFATNSYYGDLKNYIGLDGTAYLKNLHFYDYEAINWINKNISGQPVMLEAQGDSYTDYERISANTGLPTILGWTVHEWLWRGTYDVAAPRIEEVKMIYENINTQTVIPLLKQ